ncbi:unnamed protein product [Paramecium pentaurelia]|uniref:Uncharacterized protein n=1 Tax=Paramecium pentaurelia TaxID=43138 RepID=A0A8S1S1K7_9CILI|nr:unnamed protein product [Paramecium pentaurelia]
MKQEDLNYLTYGSVISISHVQDDHSFITADGFVKRSVCLKNFHHIDVVAAKNLGKMKSRPYFNTLFQIFPKFTNNTKQEILKELQGEEQEEETQPAIQNILDGIQKQQKVDEKTMMSKEQIQSFSQKLLQEFKYNLDTFEKCKSHKVSYKSHIQLLHLASSKFLACHQKEARVESSNYKITLDELPSDASLFKILPAYKYQKEGEQVIYASDIVYIVRATSLMNKLTFLHASQEMGNYGKTKKKQKSDEDLQVYRNEKDIIKREVNASLDEENQTQWRISVYSDYVPETSGCLKCGDVIWLHHSETNTTIAATRKGKPVDQKNFHSFNLVEWLGVENVELNVLSGSTKESYDEYTGDTHSMWIIEAEDYKEGGIVIFDKKYRFKHFASGLYLAGTIERFYLEKQRTAQTLFYFSQLKNIQLREKSVTRGNYAYICHENQVQEINNNYWVDIQCGKSQKHTPVLHQEQHKTDQSVFKLYASSSNDVWEISFVLSCVKTLMNYLDDVSRLKWENDGNDKEVLKDHLLKIQTTKQCIEDINDFCNNRLYNSTPEQKYGTINQFRQKLLKEQYYIDLLVKILVQQLKPEDLVLWSRRFMIIQMQDTQQQQEKMSNTEQSNKKQGLKDHELLAYVAFKINMNQSIYTLLISICKQNQENEKYTFDLIGHFLDHCRYIPEAIKCMISIIGNNQELLSQLSANMKIDYNPKEQDFFEPEEEKMQVQHHKVQNNFLIFFLNLLENDDQPHKADYLTFLREMCVYNNQGINQNQEAIYKLLKKHNHKKIALIKDKEDPDKISLKDGKLIIPFKLQNDPKEMYFINEQLQFYAHVSFGRNYLWKQELEQYFSKDFLFQNIWQDDGNKTYTVLQAALCKIAMSLYIDHDPLNRVQLPKYCNLYKGIDQVAENQHMDLYKPLIEDLFRYLQDVRNQIVHALDQKDNGENNKDYDVLEGNDEKSLLINELLYNSCQMMQLVLELDVFTLLDKEPNYYYQQIIDIVVHFFFYDFKQLQLMRSVYKQQKNEINQRKQRKDNNPLNLGANLINMANPMNLNLNNIFGSDEEQKSDTEDEEQIDDGIVDDVQMYTNPLMRGFIKLENELQSTILIREESGSNQLEIKIKLTLCNIMDRFLDMRQNYLMLNVLSFFKKQIIEKMQDGLQQTKLTKEKEELLVGMQDSEIDFLKIQQFVQSKTDLNLLGLLPNIAKTGIKDIDEKEEQKDAFGIGALNFLNKLAETKLESEEFKIFTQNIMLIYDLDQYFSLNLPQEDITKISNPIGVVLPFLFTNFSQIHEEELEKRCLAIIMRLFNQREELCNNLLKLQLISDPIKSKLYEYLSEHVYRLNQLIDRSEVWLTDFMKNSKYEDLDETLEIIDNFRQGFFKDTQIGARIMSSTQEIDPEKQNLMNALKIYEPILNLIRDQLQSLDFHLENNKNIQKKQRLAQLFIYAFQFLTYFCRNNHENQILLSQNLSSFEFIHIEVGQIPLICEIYKDNQKMLSSINKNDKVFHKFVEAIYQNGRKAQYLDFFLTIIKQGNKYLFDNQLLVLNTFLEKEELLYTERNEFIFDGEIQLHQSDFLNDLAHPPPINQPFRYHTKLLDLLLQCAYIQVIEGDQKDNFTINVAKLKKKFSLQYLISLICKQDSLTSKNPSIQDQGYGLIKKQLWIFLMNVHITSEKSHNVAKDIQNDIMRITDFEIKRLEQLSIDLSYTKYFDFLTDAVLPLFTTYLNRKNLTTRLEEDDEAHDQEQKDISQLLSFAKLLSQAMIQLGKYITRKRHVQSLTGFFSFFQTTEMGRCCISLQNQQQKWEDLGEYHNLRSVMSNIDAGANDNFQTEQLEPIINLNQNAIQQSHGDNPVPKTIFQNNNNYVKSEGAGVMQFWQKSNKKQKDEQPIIEMEFKTEDVEKIALAWEEFISHLCLADKTKIQIQAEIQKLSEAILIFEQYFGGSNDNKNEKNDKVLKVERTILIKKFINFLSYALNNNQNNKTIITLLSVLRKLIEGKSKEENQGELEVEGENNEMEEMQNLFNKLGATRMVLTVLSESTTLDSEMLRHFLMFINTLLSGGNNKVQKTISEFMKTYPKSEVIFSRLNNVIQAQIKQITIKAKDKKNEDQLQNQFQQQDEPNIQEMQQQQELELLLNQVLKFLQNCCEGHYLDLQNYIRQQSNSRNSYNMINQVAELLLTYYYKDKAQYDNMVLCLDTLNELVQGPCPENQVAVADSKFFEIASDLFGSRKEKKSAGKAQTMGSNLRTTKTQNNKYKTCRYQKQQNGSDLKAWQIERMQTKCLILILSLIEMREISDSNPIIKRIMRHITPTLLQKHLVKSFDKYEKQCKEGYQIEVLDRIKEDPKENEDGKDELILQKGFYIYFLMCYYMESDKNAENPFVQMYRANTRKKLKQDKGALEDLLFGDNIIGQLVSFVMSFANSWIDLMNQIKKEAQKQIANQNQGPDQQDKQKKEKHAEQKEEKKAEKLKQAKRAFDFFYKNSASIEVVRNNEIEIVYFILLPYTNNLPKEQKVEFHENVDRSSTKSKVQFLVQESERLIEICEHEEQLRRIFQRQKFLALFANYVKLWKDLAFLFTLLLNLFIIGSFAKNDSGNRLTDFRLFRDEKYSPQQTRNIFLICGTIMACCSIFVVSFFLFKNAPLIIRKAWKTKLPFEDKFTYWPIQLIYKIFKLLAVLFYILKEIEVVYYLAYGALAVIGTVLHPFFFSFHLTEILIRYPTLKNVIRSVWEPKQQLGLTLVLFIILVYVYGLIAYTFFFEDYKGKCQSTLFCFLFTFDWTFKANGGVGGYLSDLEDEDKVEKYQLGRFVFDNTSNIFLVIIMVNIVAGIIIDTFGSLREEESNKIRDIEDKCFICGNLKTTFDRLSDSSSMGQGFDYHIKVNHYMWNYVFFMAYLKYKDPTDYTGIEQYVWEKIQKKDLTWFPFNKARELQGLKSEEEEDSKRIERLSSDMSSVMEQMQSVTSMLNQIKNRKQSRHNAIKSVELL